MKTCSVPNCKNRIWGNGLCKAHSSFKPLKQSRLPIKERNVLKTSYIEERNKLFNSVWKERGEHVCTICGKYLGTVPLSYMFDHILEKSKYPELTFEKENLALLCLECHDKKTRGFIPENYLMLIEKIKNKFKV